MKKLFSITFLAFFVIAGSAFTTANNPKPDLAIANVEVRCNEGNNLIVVTVINQGDGRPNRRIAVSLRGQDGMSKKCIKGRAQRDLEVLRAGKSVDLEFEVGPEYDGSAPLCFEVLIDPDNLIAETDRSNNRQKFVLSCQQ